MTERFTLLSELGRGGMGVVWKARDEETGQIVALKLLRETYAEDPDYVVRFERELELAKRAHSRNVVKVLGYGVRDKTPYLALEYVDGTSLRDRLKEHGPYSWPEGKALLAQIAQGLADAHVAGVIHRDLKPSNILIGSDGIAKIADFGIAKGLDLTRVTGTSTLLGTPAYLPPEGPVDERSDLYSLGVIAFELLTGVVPFEGRTYQEVILRHVREAPDLGKLPAGARPIVGWLLAKDPEQRPKGAAELLPVLRGVNGLPTGAGVESSPVPPPNLSAAPAPSRPAPVWQPTPAPTPTGVGPLGYSQPSAAQPGWGRSPKSGHGCLITFLIVLVLLVVGVGCAIFALPYVQTYLSLQRDLQGKTASIEMVFSEGEPTWVIQLGPGYDSGSQATDIACNVVHRDLEGTQFVNHFQLVDSQGDFVADNMTPCQ